jgi:hypothetical protein
MTRAACESAETWIYRWFGLLLAAKSLILTDPISGLSSGSSARGPPYLDLWPGPQYIAATCCRPVLRISGAALKSRKQSSPLAGSSFETRAGR